MTHGAYRTLAFALLALSAGCAQTPDSPTRYEGASFPASRFSASDLSMPSGWNPAVLERLEQGKNPKTTIAVVEFVRNEGLPQGLDLKLEDMLITSLIRTGKLDVVERARLEHVMAEQDRANRFVAAGTTRFHRNFDPATAPAFGKLVGAQGIVYGTVTSATEDKDDRFAYDLLTYQVELDVRAVDTETGKVFLSERATGTYSAKLITTADGTVIAGGVKPAAAYANAAKQAVDSVAGKIAAHYPLLGLVVDVRNDKVYLDVGETRGGRKDDEFIIFRKGDEIVKPGTQTRLGWEKVVIGAVKVTSSEKEMAVAKLVKLANSQVPPSPGDFAISVGNKAR
jgi:curli biogenesis system outer membrane secretion channel CsgG